MPDFVFNISKGGVAEYARRVDAGDPAAARLYVIPVDVAAVSDATLQDVADFAAVIAAGVTERTTGGWNRKTIDAAALPAPTVDNTNNRYVVDLPDQTWTAVTTGAVTDLIICYASVSSPTNAQLIPLTQHDFPITPDGSDVVAQINDFYRAS